MALLATSQPAMPVQTMPVQTTPARTPPGRTAPNSSWRDRCLAAALLTLPLSLFGEILVRRTHHRPLGAATFASVTIVSFLLLWSVAAGLRQRWTPPVGTWVERALWTLATVGLLVAIARAVG
jgi:hypothetical protein